MTKIRTKIQTFFNQNGEFYKPIIFKFLGKKYRLSSSSFILPGEDGIECKHPNKVHQLNWCVFHIHYNFKAVHVILCLSTLKQNWALVFKSKMNPDMVVVVPLLALNFSAYKVQYSIYSLYELYHWWINSLSLYFKGISISCRIFLG